MRKTSWIFRCLFFLLIFISSCFPQEEPDPPEGHYCEGLVDYGDGATQFCSKARLIDKQPSPKTLQNRPKPLPGQPVSDWSPTKVVFDEASQLNPEEPIFILVALTEVPFNFFSFQNLGSNSEPRKKAIIKARKASLQEIQDSVSSSLFQLGAQVLNRFWLTNSLYVRAKAGTVKDIRSLPNVIELYTTKGKLLPLQNGYHGLDIRFGTLSDHFHESLILGNWNGRDRGISSAQKIGISESIKENLLNSVHVGWFDWNSTETRIKDNVACWRFPEPFYLMCLPSPITDTTLFHGTYVSWVAAGSIEEGQDPSYPSTIDRKKRSGSAPESEIFYYNIGNEDCGILLALERALQQGIDVFNMSWYDKDGNFCRSDYDWCSLNKAFRHATDAGILLVGGAGNFGHLDDPPCTVQYPAYRSEVVSVGALDSYSDIGYRWLELWIDPPTIPEEGRRGSSHGYVPVRQIDGSLVHSVGVDIVAPGRINYMFKDGPFGYYYDDPYNKLDDIVGTSMAAPVVSAAASLLREALADIGWTGGYNARALRVNLMLAGDASMGTGITGYSHDKVASKTGFGRIRMHWPSSRSLVAPWGWGWRTFVIHSGETVAWTVGDAGAEYSSVKQMKWAFFWDEPDMNSVSDIMIELWDTCPQAGGEERIMYDNTFNLNKRIKYFDVGGRCLEMRASALQTPPDGTRIYSADYFHSGPTDVH